MRRLHPSSSPGGLPLVTVVDLGSSHPGPLLHALHRAGLEAHATRDAVLVRDARAVVLAGGGTFGDGMASLRAAGLVDVILDHAGVGRPILGIGLGMHLLAEMGTEGGAHRGLGLVAGTVLRLETDHGAPAANVGWCDVTVIGEGGPIAADGCCWFSHTHHLHGPEADRQAVIDLGERQIAAAVARGSVWGTQFRPEKSQDDGLAVLTRFAAAVRAGAPA